jgi:hypothetical protein
MRDGAIGAVTPAGGFPLPPGVPFPPDEPGILPRGAFVRNIGVLFDSNAYDDDMDDLFTDRKKMSNPLLPRGNN